MFSVRFLSPLSIHRVAEALLPIELAQTCSSLGYYYSNYLLMKFFLFDEVAAVCNSLNNLLAILRSNIPYAFETCKMQLGGAFALWLSQN